MDYLRCTLTDMDLSGSYPDPPNIIYLPYPPLEIPDIIGTVVFLGGTFSFEAHDWLATSPVNLIYRSHVHPPAYHDYARLHSNLNADFAAALAVGNLSGSYIGRNGETWDISHYTGVDSFSLPSGSGGEAGTLFTYDPPVNTPPNKATNPSPAHEAVNVNLGVGLDWD